MCGAWRVARKEFFVGFGLILLTLAGCSPALVKPAALDGATVRDRLPAEDLLRSTTGDEQVIVPDPAWLSGLKPQQELTFLGVNNGFDHTYGVLLEIDLAGNRLRYLPLPPDDSPLTLLNNPQRRAALEKFVMPWPQGRGRFAEALVRDIPLDQLTERLTSPIPRPGQIYAVAANYPSHLFNDLSLPAKEGLIAQLQKARPRIFQKYPPVTAPGESRKGAEAYTGLPGPFDTLSAPEHVWVPALNGQNRGVAGHLDYEVEVAVLIGRELSWDEVREMSDDELRRAVAGTLLFSDAKVRDPQVMGKIVRAFREESVDHDNPYRVGDTALDGTLGAWNETTCHWWSYAASWGRFAAHGPFLVASSDTDEFPSRAILAARSYTSDPARPISPPRGVPTDQLLLRQAALTTTAADYPDALVWGVPAIIRSLLDPAGNALAFTGETPLLHAGDLIALGTPGGTVISAKPWWLLPMAEDLLFWREPAGFYDMFFDPTAGYYLHPGDELFLWGEGLGYQHLRIATPGQ